MQQKLESRSSFVHYLFKMQLLIRSFFSHFLIYKRFILREINIIIIIIIVHAHKSAWMIGTYQQPL